MKITPPNDDEKLQSLNRPRETRGVESRPVEEVDTIRRPSPAPELREPQARTRVERRKKQRRQKREQALLDTREPRERRQSLRRKDDQKPTEERKEETTQGIDVIV